MIGLHDTGGGGLAWFVCWRRGAGLRRQGVGGRHRAGRPAHRPLLVLLLQRAVRRVGRGRAPPAAAGYLQGRQQIASDIASDSDQLAGQLTPLGSLHMRGAHAAKANCGLSLGSITCMNMHPIPHCIASHHGRLREMDSSSRGKLDFWGSAGKRFQHRCNLATTLHTGC